VVGGVGWGGGQKVIPRLSADYFVVVRRQNSAVIFNVLPTKAKESNKVTAISFIKRELGAIQERLRVLIE
jgi:hypothetical protein